MQIENSLAERTKTSRNHELPSGYGTLEACCYLDFFFIFFFFNTDLSYSLLSPLRNVEKFVQLKISCLASAAAGYNIYKYFSRHFWGNLVTIKQWVMGLCNPSLPGRMEVTPGRRGAAAGWAVCAARRVLAASSTTSGGLFSNSRVKSLACGIQI